VDYFLFISSCGRGFIIFESLFYLGFFSIKLSKFINSLSSIVRLSSTYFLFSSSELKISSYFYFLNEGKDFSTYLS